MNNLQKTDDQVEAEYYQSQGLNCQDIGSVYLRRKQVNKKLNEKGYAKLRKYKSKRELIAIGRSL